MANARMKLGKELSAEAQQVVKANRHLYGFVIRSAVATLATMAVLGGGAVVAAAVLDDDAGSALAILLVVVAGLACACIVARFQGAMVASADTALRGEPSAYEQGMHVSAGHVGTLTQWGLINGTVGLVLGALQSGGGQSGGIGAVLRIVGALISVAWGAITFFVIPVILFERTSAVAAIKRSTHILKETWGPGVVGVVRIGVRYALIFLLPGALLLVGGIYLAVSAGDSATVALGGLLAAIGLVLFIVGVIVNSTVRAVFGVALYRYATGGEALGPFSEEQLVGAMRRKGER